MNSQKNFEATRPAPPIPPYPKNHRRSKTTIEHLVVKYDPSKTGGSQGPSILISNDDNNSTTPNANTNRPLLDNHLPEGLEADNEPNYDKPPKSGSPKFSAFSKIFGKKLKNDWGGGSCGSNSSKFYLNDGLLSDAKVGRHFQAGINHSISMNLEGSHHHIHEGSSSSKLSSSIQKLNSLTDEERIELQVFGFEQLDERLKLKVEARNQLKSEMEDLNKSIVNNKEQIRSMYEIEALRNKIRILTNEKAELEMKYSKHSNWICHQCTYSNSFDCSNCVICEVDRQDDEILICYHCGKRNPLSNLSCVGCNHNFNIETSSTPNNNNNQNNPPNNMNHQNSLNSNSGVTNLNRLFSTNSNSSLTSNSNNTPPLSPMPLQPSIPFVPTKNGRY